MRSIAALRACISSKLSGAWSRREPTSVLIFNFSSGLLMALSLLGCPRLIPCCSFVCRSALADAVPKRPGVARITVASGDVVVGPLDLAGRVAVGAAHLRARQRLTQAACP